MRGGWNTEAAGCVLFGIGALLACARRWFGRSIGGWFDERIEWVAGGLSLWPLASSMRRWGHPLVGVLVAVAAVAGPAGASAQPLPLTPFVECVASLNGFSRAWFGYSNTGGNTITIEPGDDNAISPGEPFQAQPTTFAIGTFPRAF